MEPDGQAIKAVVDWCQSNLDGHRLAVAEALGVVEKRLGRDLARNWEATVLVACVSGFEEQAAPI